MSAVTPATDVAPAHMIETFEGTVVESDYKLRFPGDRLYIGRCSCGWSTVRQMRHATENQIRKHRRQVA